MSEEKPLASEGGHWYDRRGAPVYEVKDSTGKKMITPDIRHARKLLLVPGVTSITRCAAAPGLVQWQVYQGIIAALDLPRREHEPEASYLRRVYDRSKEKAQQAADEGSRIHAAIESFDRQSAYRLHVQAAYDTLTNNFGLRDWAPEFSFADTMGYGSKIDLLADAGGIIVDTKTKDWDNPDDGPAVYDEHGMQLAAYRHAIGDRSTVCANLFVSRTTPGLACLRKWKPEDLDRCWEMFKSLHAYWCQKNRYNPGW